MAKLVIGTSKQTVVPAVVRDFSPSYYIEKLLDGNGVLKNYTNFINLNGTTDIGNGVLAYQYTGVVFPANTVINMNSLTSISGSNACASAFASSRNIKSVDLSSLITVSGINACQNMFSSCSSLTDIDLSSLTTVSEASGCANMFLGDSGLTSIDLSSLTTISGNSACQSMFSGCNNLVSVDISGLTTVSGGNGCLSMFYGCTKLTSINFSSLTTISGTSSFAGILGSCLKLKSFKANKLNVISVQISPSYSTMFTGCPDLELVEFGGLTASTFSSAVNQFQYLFNSTTGSTATNGCTVHFPSNFDPSDPNHTFDASTLAGYPTFGGNASYIHVAFDLPATE